MEMTAARGRGRDAMHKAGEPSVLDALRQQVECYRRLARLSDAQHEHVRQGRTENLLDVLRQRQRELDRIASLERDVASARRNWQQYLASLDGQDRSAAESLMAETRVLLERITAGDRDDALVLQQQKLGLEREMGQAAASMRAGRQYVPAAAQRPSNLDVHT